MQGVLSGVAFAVGYGVGRLIELAWELFQLPWPAARWWQVARLSIALASIATVVVFLWQTTHWQNSIRKLMELEPETTAYPFSVGWIALVTAGVLLVVGRGIQWVWRGINRRMTRVVSPRVAFVLSTLVVVLLLELTVNKIVGKALLRAADKVFLELDRMEDAADSIPTDPFVTGSRESLIEWNSIGRRGREFLVAGPTQDDIARFLGRGAQRPIRVYAGYRSVEDVDARAKLAFDELKRVGGFERSILIVATPTGTGWLDENAVDTVEYLHAGDTAMVAMGYSYLPSWMTLLVDPERSRESARALFARVYEHWKTLPRDRRPKLYLHGLSLGSLGAESCTDLYTLIGDPIQGGVFSGPPSLSGMWSQLTRDRNPDSPIWLPRFHDGSVVRFTALRNALPAGGDRWGPVRFVYIQHASDPMVFFFPDLPYRSPAWLQGERGPDVSPYLRWYPLVTSLQLFFDLATSTNVPLGYGHNYHSSSYIDAWVAVTEPPQWSVGETHRLKAHFNAARAGAQPSSP